MGRFAVKGIVPFLFCSGSGCLRCNPHFEMKVVDMPQMETCSANGRATAGAGIVHFMGAGPGDPELLTLKAQRLSRQADLILHAGSLVNPSILEYARPEALEQSSTRMTLAEQVALMRHIVVHGGSVARLHTGDPSIFEQMRAPDEAVGLRLPDRMDDARLYAPRRFLAEITSPGERSVPFDISIRR